MGRFPLLSLIFPALALAQSATPVTYQGYLTGAGNSPVSGVMSITFKLFRSADADSDRVPLWSETQSLGISGGSYATSLALTSSQFDGNERYLELTVGDVTLQPRQRVGWVPHALLCENVSGETVRTERLTVSEAAAVTGTGRLAGFTSKNTTLTGDATRLLHELEPGDAVVVDPSGSNLAFQVIQVNSDTEIVVSPPVAADFLPKSFTIRKAVIRASVIGGTAALTLASNGNLGIRSVELGVPTNGGPVGVNPVTGGLPYVDFHYGNGKSEDYNARIINDAEGQLSLQATKVLVRGNLEVQGTLSPGPEAPHKVGNPGEPAYLNGWSDWTDAEFDVGAHFYKIPLTGEVVLVGLVKVPSDTTTDLFVLPPGYRPGKSKIFAASAHNGANAQIVVRGNGAVFQNGPISSAVGLWLSLSGIRFRAEQ